MNESKMTRPHKNCLDTSRWTADEPNPTENEVCEGIGGIVKLVQPLCLVEMGTYKGHSTYWMLKNMRPDAKLYSFDIVDRREGVHQRIKDIPQSDRAEVIVLPADEIFKWPDSPFARPIDFAFLDSGPGPVRRQQFEALRPFMDRNCVVLFHDSYTDRQVAADLEALQKEKKIVYVNMPTPRGLAICRLV